MPLYEFECENGHRSERFYRISDKPEWLLCDECGKSARQIPAIGGIQGDSPVWLNDEVRGALQDTDLIRQKKVKPIETRKELNYFTRTRGLVCVG